MKTVKGFLLGISVFVLLGAALTTVYLAPRVHLTLADMDVVSPSKNAPMEFVLGLERVGDVRRVVSFRYDPTNALPISDFIRAVPSGIGRRVHDWDGDAGIFGVRPSLLDNGPAINRANTNAILAGIPLLLPEGSLKVATWVSLVSGTHIRGKGMGKTIILRNSAVASQTNTHVHSTFQTPGVFNPYLTNGGHGPYITASSTKGTIEDLSISDAVGSYSGFPIAIMAAEDFTVQRVEVYGVTNHWAITLHGNRLKVVDCRINNIGRIYQDGVHVVAGVDGIISRNFFLTGDDSVALSTAWATDTIISNWLISDNYLYSSHGHIMRMMQENASATNQYQGIRWVNNFGLGGKFQNGIVRISSVSTNLTYAFKDVSITGGDLQMGSVADHGNNPNLGGFGIYADHCQGLTLNNVTIGPTFYEAIRIMQSDDVHVNNCFAYGAEYASFYNTTIRAEDVRKIIFRGGGYRNTFTNGFSTILLNGVDKAEFYGTYISNRTTAGAAISCQTNGTVAPGAYVLVNASVIDSLSQGIYAQSGAPASIMYNNTLFNAPFPTSITNIVQVSSWGNRGTFTGSTNETVRGALTVQSTLTAEQSAVIGQHNSVNALEIRGGASGAALLKLTRTNVSTVHQVGFASSDGLIVQNLSSNWVTAGLQSFQSSVNWRLGGSAYNPAAHSRVASRPAYILGEQSTGTDQGGERIFVYLPNGTGAGSTATNWLSVFAPVAGASGTTAQSFREVFRASLTTGTGATGLRIEDDAGVLRQVKQGTNGTGPGGVGRALYTD